MTRTFCGDTTTVPAVGPCDRYRRAIDALYSIGPVSVESAPVAWMCETHGVGMASGTHMSVGDISIGVNHTGAEDPAVLRRIAERLAPVAVARSHAPGYAQARLVVEWDDDAEAVLLDRLAATAEVLLTDRFQQRFDQLRDSCVENWIDDPETDETILLHVRVTTAGVALEAVWTAYEEGDEELFISEGRPVAVSDDLARVLDGLVDCGFDAIRAS